MLVEVTDPLAAELFDGHPVALPHPSELVDHQRAQKGLTPVNALIHHPKQHVVDPVPHGLRGANPTSLLHEVGEVGYLDDGVVVTGDVGQVHAGCERPGLSGRLRADGGRVGPRNFIHSPGAPHTASQRLRSDSIGSSLASASRTVISNRLSRRRAPGTGAKG